MPEPAFVNATVPPVPALSLMIPEKVVEVLSPPAVKVDVVLTVEFNTVPAPVNDPIVSEYEAKSKVPVTVTAELSEIPPAAPSFNVVPVEINVYPE